MTCITKVQCDRCGCEAEKYSEGWICICRDSGNGWTRIQIHGKNRASKSTFDFCTTECLAAFASKLGAAHKTVAEAKPEETYSVGDWIAIDDALFTGSVYLLVSGTDQHLALVNILNGRRWSWAAQYTGRTKEIPSSVVEFLVAGAANISKKWKKVTRAEAFKMMGLS